jgi:hypothetical protein
VGWGFGQLVVEARRNVPSEPGGRSHSSLLCQWSRIVPPAPFNDLVATHAVDWHATLDGNAYLVIARAAMPPTISMGSTWPCLRWIEEDGYVAHLLQQAVQGPRQRESRRVAGHVWSDGLMAHTCVFTPMKTIDGL